MTTQEIYLKFDTPQNLVDHMLTVAGLALRLKDTWSGPDIDWDNLVMAALFHDIGNVVKFDLDKFPSLLGSELSRIDYWRQKQSDLIKKYGTDDHEATDKILMEINVSNRVRQIISSKSFGNAITISRSDDYESKVLLYCDLRVLPDHIGTLEERLDDIAQRLTKYSERPDFNDLVTAAHQLEKVVNQYSGNSLENVTQQDLLDKYSDQLLNRSNKA